MTLSELFQKFSNEEVRRLKFMNMRDQAESVVKNPAVLTSPDNKLYGSMSVKNVN